jgi:RNA-directed DNA polymerase
MKELADKLNPVVCGWIECYGAFFQSELIFLVYHLDKLIYRWVIRKYKKHGSNFKRAENWVKRIKRTTPDYFVHWRLLRA